MSIIARFYRAFVAFRARAKLGALQGGLIFNIKQSGADSARAQHFVSQIAVTAWRIPPIAELFQKSGFSFEDYEVMYRTAVMACPNKLVANKNLVATFLLIDNFDKLAAGFLSMSNAVSGQTSVARKTGLEMLTTLTVNDVLKSALEQGYPQLTKLRKF